MALRTTVEILVYLDSFRNVDLLERGVYRLRLSVQQEGGERARPVSLVQSEAPKENYVTLPRLHEPSRAFLSRAFRILYADEEVLLEEGAVFAMDLIVSPKKDPTLADAVLLVELLFSPKSQPEDSIAAVTSLHVVAERRLNMRRLVRGLGSALTLTFDEFHFAAVPISVHTSVVSVERLSSPLFPPSPTPPPAIGSSPPSPPGALPQTPEGSDALATPLPVMMLSPALPAPVQQFLLSESPAMRRLSSANQRRLTEPSLLQGETRRRGRSSGEQPLGVILRMESPRKRRSVSPFGFVSSERISPLATSASLPLLVPPSQQLQQTPQKLSHQRHSSGLPLTPKAGVPDIAPFAELGPDFDPLPMENRQQQQQQQQPQLEQQQQPQQSFRIQRQQTETLAEFCIELVARAERRLRKQLKNSLELLHPAQRELLPQMPQEDPLLEQPIQLPTVQTGSKRKSRGFFKAHRGSKSSYYDIAESDDYEAGTFALAVRIEDACVRLRALWAALARVYECCGGQTTLLLLLVKRADRVRKLFVRAVYLEEVTGRSLEALVLQPCSPSHGGGRCYCGDVAARYRKAPNFFRSQLPLDVYDLSLNLTPQEIPVFFEQRLELNRKPGSSSFSLIAADSRQSQVVTQLGITGTEAKRNRELRLEEERSRVRQSNARRSVIIRLSRPSDEPPAPRVEEPPDYPGSAADAPVVAPLLLRPLDRSPALPEHPPEAPPLIRILAGSSDETASLSMGAPGERASGMFAVGPGNRAVELEAQELDALRRPVHAIVFVHGLAGNSWDLRPLRDYVKALFPGNEYLIVRSLERDTMRDISEMGALVADEVARWIETGREETLGRLSFVGHSLGGIILRAALANPRLERFRQRFYTFMTISSPHLGTQYSQTKIVPSAMWVWQKWTKSQCLRQLSLQDREDACDGLLFQLSAAPVLQFFRNVVLISSEQDLYVPYYSARMEPAEIPLGKGSPSSKHINVVQQMARNLLDPVLLSPRTQLIRYSVVFGPSALTGVDAFLGRAAHIRFLDDHTWMQMFLSLYSHYFEPADVLR